MSSFSSHWVIINMKMTLNISISFNASESFSHHGCYWMNICDQIQFIHWNLVPSVMIFSSGTSGKWLGSEIGVLMNEKSVLVKHTPQSSLACPPCGNSEIMVVYEPESWPSPDVYSISALILNLKASKSWEIKVCCIRHLVHSTWL